MQFKNLTKTKEGLDVRFNLNKEKLDIGKE